MADELLDQVRDALEGQIDFEGQRLADQLNNYMLLAAGLIAFVVGWATQDIRQTLYIGLGGTALTFLAVVPPWPTFNKSPVPWLPSLKQSGGVNIEVDGKRIS